MKRNLFLLFIVISFAYSCQVQQVAVDVYSPSKVEFPPEFRSILLTSRYVPATGPYEDVQWGAFESVDSIRWALSESVIDSLGKNLIVGNHFLIKVRHFPKMLRNNTADLPEQQPWDGMAALAKKEMVQGILVLEGFGFKPGEINITPAVSGFNASQNYSVTLALRVYEPEKRRFVDDSVYTFNHSFTGIGATRVAAVRALPDTIKGAFQSVGAAAVQYAQLILPSRIPVKRFLYSKGDSLLLVADSARLKGNWNRAEGKWSYLAYNSKDTVIMARASFNMALACERGGRLNQALGFARRSERLKPDRRIHEYIELLEGKMAAYQAKIREREIIRNW